MTASLRHAWAEGQGRLLYEVFLEREEKQLLGFELEPESLEVKRVSADGLLSKRPCQATS